MSASEREDEASRERRLRAQSRLLQGLLDFLPDPDDTREDLSRHKVGAGIDWSVIGVQSMSWNRSLPVPRRDAILAPSVSPSGLTQPPVTAVGVEVPEVLFISREDGRIIAQFRREQDWPTVNRVLLVVRVGLDHWVYEIPVLFANELSLYVDLGTDIELRDRVQEARRALVSSPDAEVSFEFILSADDGDPSAGVSPVTAPSSSPGTAGGCGTSSRAATCSWPARRRRSS